MTIKEAAQSAAFYLTGRRPNAIVSSQDEFETELFYLAQEAATDIAKAYDWQTLFAFHEIVSDGSATYPKPSDYDRMIPATDIYDPSTWCWGYRHVMDVGEWLRLVGSGFHGSPGSWIIIGDEFRFSPAPAEGNKATFAYISDAVFRASNGTPKSKIDRDDDEFRLDERLLTLGIIWRWKAAKQMDYQEDIRNYDIALSQAMARDKGARVIRRNSRSTPLNLHVGWPWPLGEGA